MKKFFCSFILVIMLVLMTLPLTVAQADVPTSMSNLSAEEVVVVIENAKDVAIGINDVGFVIWMKSNWWFFILSLVGLGRIIIYFTPSKEDDKWYAKYVLKPLKFIGKFISGGVGADKDPSK